MQVYFLILLFLGLPVHAELTVSEMKNQSDLFISNYVSVVNQYQSTLHVVIDEKSKNLNAVSTRKGNVWTITLAAAIADFSETNNDTFDLILCHEFGHQVGGYPFHADFWYSSEGQADYFATQACLRQMWLSDVVKNANARLNVRKSIQTLCDQAWKNSESQNLCYRILNASQRLANFHAFRDQEKNYPLIETPSIAVVSESKWGHPRAQCRLDTYVAGALCAVNFDFSFVPSSLYEMQNTSCVGGVGARPQCWFAD